MSSIERLASVMTGGSNMWWRYSRTAGGGAAERVADRSTESRPGTARSVNERLRFMHSQLGWYGVCSYHDRRRHANAASPVCARIADALAPIESASARYDETSPAP